MPNAFKSKKNVSIYFTDALISNIYYTRENILLSRSSSRHCTYLGTLTQMLLNIKVYVDFKENKQVNNK